MIQISGFSAVGSLVGVSAFYKTSGKNKSSENKLKIIVAGAHPDDPESGCGGTMALLSAEGHDVISAYLTRGEAGIPGKSYEEAAQIRTDEALKACKILNVRSEFLGQIDGNCEITGKRYTEINNFVKHENPDIVFTHWPVDSHRDHRICSNLFYDAWINMGRKFSLFYFEVDAGIQTQNFLPSNYINISPVKKQKIAACRAHVSQNPEDFYENVHVKMERFRGLEFNCEFAEAFIRHNQNPETFISRLY